MNDQKTLAVAQAHIDHLEMLKIVKRFPGVLANDCIDFDVRAGEMHALLGENGAGKSTLMRVLYGLYRPDQGEVRINGEPVHIGSPLDAIRRRRAEQAAKISSRRRRDSLPARKATMLLKSKFGA